MLPFHQVMIWPVVETKVVGFWPYDFLNTSTPYCFMWYAFRFGSHVLPAAFTHSLAPARQVHGARRGDLFVLLAVDVPVRGQVPDTQPARAQDAVLGVPVRMRGTDRRPHGLHVPLLI